MNENDRAAAILSAAILRGNDRNIEAMALEAIADDPESEDLDAAIVDASHSDVKPGAFGMEILGALVVPIVIEAARQFWAAYSKKLTEKTGERLADWTIEKFKHWFLKADNADRLDARDRLVDRIRNAGVERGMSSDDIEAIVETITPERLSEYLAATE